MDDAALERLGDDPHYRRLVRRRGRLGVALTAIVMTAYLGFILLVAFDKSFLGRSLAGGATTIGIPIGLGVIGIAILSTAFYVYRANRAFDGEVAAIVAEASLVRGSGE